MIFFCLFLLCEAFIIPAVKSRREKKKASEKPAAVYMSIFAKRYTYSSVRVSLCVFCKDNDGPHKGQGARHDLKVSPSEWVI